MGIYKRVYDSNIKKLGITGIALVFGIFIYLSNNGDITITGYSGDSKCAGTIEEPCYAFLNFTANKDIYIYPTNDSTWAFNVTPEHLMKEIKMQRIWGTGWRTIDLSKSYSKNVKYAVKFSSGQKYSLRFIGYKNNINDTVEWAFGKESLFNNKSFIDPLWNGYNTDDFMPKLIYNKADITGGEAVFEYCNPTSFEIDYSGNKLNFAFNKVKGDFNTFEVSVGSKINITRNKTDYFSNITYLKTGHFETDNSTSYFVNDTIENKWNETRTITEEMLDYAVLDGSLKKIKPNECKNILIKGAWNAGKEISIDWIPEIEVSGVKFKQDKFAWWNASWNATYPINVNTSTNVTDYQLQIVFPQGSCNANYSDFRVTATDNSTVLSHWLESNTSTNATIWFKGNFTVLNGTQAYAWCGNPSATSTSNITGVWGNNLSGLWLFNENTGSSAKDSFGGNNGTIYNGAWNSSGTRKWVEYNGTSTNTTIPRMDIENGNFSLTFKLRIDNISGQLLNYVVSKSDGSTGWEIGVLGTYSTVCGGTDGKVFIYKGTEGTATCSKTILNTGTWYDIAMAYNGSMTALYINGTFENATSQTITSKIAPISVGRQSIGTAWYTDGGIDDLKFWNRTLSSSEIANMYAATEPTASIGAEKSNPETSKSAITLYFNGTSYTPNYNETGAVLIMPFAEGTGTKAYDLSPFNNTGTLTNMNEGIDNGSSGWTSSGKFGNAIMFDGTNDTVSITTGTFDNLTITLWVFSGLTQNSGALILGSGSWASEGAWRLWRVSTENNFGMSYVSPQGQVHARAGESISTYSNTWSFITVIVNSTNVAYYRNGIIKQSSAINKTSLRSAINIGSYGSSSFFNGSIDEVRIYNRSLSATEISEMYNQTKEMYNDYSNFYELGDPVNVTACSNITDQTVYISSNHPNIGSGLNGTTINGTTCATYLWNTSNVVISQFNSSATTENHTANNVSGITIHSVTDLQSGQMYLKGLNKNSTYSSYVEAPDSYTTDVELTNGTAVYDSNWGTRSGMTDGVTITNTENVTASEVNNDDTIIGFDFKYRGECFSVQIDAVTLYAWNFSSNNWVTIGTGNLGDGTANLTISSNTVNGLLSGKTLWLNYSFLCTWPAATPGYLYETGVTFNYNVSYPYNLSIDIGDDSITDFWTPYAYIKDVYAIVNRFKTNVLNKNLTFSRSGTNVTYIQAPCNSQANSLSWNVSGGNGTKSMDKVDNLATPRHFVFSTENSGNSISFYYPASSTVNRHNITITGHPYYSSATALSATCCSGSNNQLGYTYYTTASKAYGDDSSIYLYGNVFIGEYGSNYPGGYVTLSLVGTGGTRASCTSSYINPGYYTDVWGSCYASLTGKYAAENLWVTASDSHAGSGRETLLQDGSNYWKRTYFSGLNQYDINNATNITIWYNGTNLEYQNLNELNSSVSWNINLSSTNMNNYLASCTQDPCPVPYTIKTTKRGNVSITTVDGDYTNSISNITYDVANDGVTDASISGSSIPNNNVTIGSIGLNAINSYIQSNCVNNSVSVPIVATSETAGTETNFNLIGNFSINPITLNLSAIRNYMSFNKTLTINDSADSYGYSGSSGTNYGTETTTISGVNVISQTYRSYFMFDLSSIPANMSIIFANMSLWASSYVNNATQTMDAYNTSNNWNETGITWDNAPSSDTLQDSVNLTESGRWYSWNVLNAANTTYYKANKNMSILIIQSPEGGNKRYGFTSKEGTATVPKIEIKYVPIGNVNVPIKYTADNWGILNTYGLSITANTDYNYTFTGWASSAVSNMTKTLKLIWSNFSMSFPQSWIDYPEFIPSTNSSKNVTPTGQSDAVPIFNFSYLAREQPINISIYLNTSINSCANITVSSNENKTSGRILNTTILYDWVTNFSSGTKGLWAWADLDNCDPAASRWLAPDFMFRSKCSSCV